MSDRLPADPPSAFVVEWVERLGRAAAEGSSPRALDVAMGTGRHARVLADAGYIVFGVDKNLDAIRTALARNIPVRAWVADLTVSPLPPCAFDLVVVTRYLDRGLFPGLTASLTESGVVLYETFLEAQLRLGRGPTSADHLLREGELRERFGDLEVLFYEELLMPEAVARIVARRVRRD
jgi:SAM-dependent methyltransferase